MVLHAMRRTQENSFGIGRTFVIHNECGFQQLAVAVGVFLTPGEPDSWTAMMAGILIPWWGWRTSTRASIQLTNC